MAVTTARTSALRDLARQGQRLWPDNVRSQLILYGAEADENIHLFAMAVRLGVTREQLGQLANACPTRASGLLCMLQDYGGHGPTPH